MDQTIREIVRLDAAVEERLSAAEAACRKQISDARAQAAAVTEATEHQTRDAIVEYEESARGACEQKLAELRAEFDRRGDQLSEQFESRRAELLDTLFQETLREAEA